MTIGRWTHVSVVALVVGTALACAAISEAAYWWYAGEEGFVEALQVVFFVLALVISLRARPVFAAMGENGLARIFMLAAAGLFFLVGEEISWGQRIFGWTTPEKLAEINRQGETTLHNIGGLHEAMGWAQLLVGAYGTILPLWVRRDLGRWTTPLRAIVPAVRFIPYFAPLFVWRVYRAGFSLPKQNPHAITQLNEVFELTMAIGMFLMLRDVLRRARAKEL